MLTFEFVPIINERQTGVSGLSSGRMVVSGEHGECASPADRPMMLLVSVCDLMSGLTAFLTRGWDKQYIFSTMHGDYGLKVVKKKGSPLLSLYCAKSGGLIARATQDELTEALWAAAQRLDARYKAGYAAVVSAPGSAPFEADSKADSKADWEASLVWWLSSFPERSPRADGR